MVNPLKDIQWRPSLEERRNFGRTLVVGGPALALAFALLAWGRTGAWVAWPWMLGAVIVGLGLFCWAAPGLARPLYVAWYAVAGVIGLVVSNTLLLLVFYVVITPVGWLVRMAGRDPLEREWDRERASYWAEAEKPVDARQYFRQF
jgi:hypothetical protein